MSRGFLYLMMAATLVVAAGQLALWHPRLPDLVPSHFGLQGVPDGWMPRTAFVSLIGGLHLLTMGMMVLIAVSLRYIPNALINIPHRDVWLSDNHRAETISTCGTILMMVAIVTSWLIIGIFHLTALVAIERQAALMPAFWLLLAIYLIAVLVICVLGMRRFQRPPQASG